MCQVLFEGAEAEHWVKHSPTLMVLTGLVWGGGRRTRAKR